MRCTTTPVSQWSKKTLFVSQKNTFVRSHQPQGKPKWLVCQLSGHPSSRQTSQTANRPENKQAARVPHQRLYPSGPKKRVLFAQKTHFLGARRHRESQNDWYARHPCSRQASQPANRPEDKQTARAAHRSLYPSGRTKVVLRNWRHCWLWSLRQSESKGPAGRSSFSHQYEHQPGQADSVDIRKMCFLTK